MFWSHNASAVAKRRLEVHVLGAPVIVKGSPTVHVLELLRYSGCKAQSGSTCSGRFGSYKGLSGSTCSRVTLLWQYMFWSHNSPAVAKRSLVVHVLESQRFGSF
ncbi:hypothetical protein AMTRI_Chr08g166400 [Amborella trichopoda]